MNLPVKVFAGFVWTVSVIALVFLWSEAASSLLVAFVASSALNPDRFGPVNLGWEAPALAVLPVALTIIGVAAWRSRTHELARFASAISVIFFALMASLGVWGAGDEARSLHAAATADSTAWGKVSEQHCYGNRGQRSSTVEFTAPDGRTFRTLLSQCDAVGDVRQVLYVAADPSVSTANTDPTLLRSAARDMVSIPMAACAIVVVSWAFAGAHVLRSRFRRTLSGLQRDVQ